MGNRQEIIESLNEERDNYLRIWNNSWNEEEDKYEISEPKEIDDLSEQIWNNLRDHQDVLPVEFVIESMTRLGHAPNILYDDNGNFAICDDGYQSISDEIIDQEMAFFVKKERWFPTIRLALNYYLNEK